jgi:hypothetical protein|tara:strand:- start:1003 stop:1212 length:210 start_codon:yes stop_codon:yes gene_type:complete
MLNQIKNIDSIRASYGVEAVFLLVGIWFNWNLILYVLVVENFISFLTGISVIKVILEKVGVRKTGTVLR